MNVSYFNYRRMHEHIRTEIRKELTTFLSLDDDFEFYTYGRKYQQLFRTIFGKGHYVSTDSGTSALQFALTVLGVKKGDEVITTPHTYIATALAISNCGAIPKFVDVDKENMLLDLGLIEEHITHKTSAILPVHLNGLMVDMDMLHTIARKHKLRIIEDAAQSHLATINGKGPSRKSDAACYSLFLNKNVSGIGNGGLIQTQSRGFARKANILCNADSNNSFLLQSLRSPAYLDFIQLVFLKAKEKYFAPWTKKRKEIAKIYSEELKHTPLKLPKCPKKAEHVYRDYVVRTKNRDAFQKFLRKKGIQTMIHYPVPVHLSKTFRSLGYKKGDYPHTEEVCDTVLSLPINPFLYEDEVFYIVKAIKSFFR